MKWLWEKKMFLTVELAVLHERGGECHNHSKFSFLCSFFVSNSFWEPNLKALLWSCWRKQGAVSQMPSLEGVCAHVQVFSSKLLLGGRVEEGLWLLLACLPPHPVALNFFTACTPLDSLACNWLFLNLLNQN